MSITLFGNSDQSAVIELEKEIEPSATKASLVTVDLVFEVKAKAAVKVLVNKVVVSEVLPGEELTATTMPVTFEVAAGQKYEVKKATGLKEALASIAPEVTTIAPADVETLTAEGEEAKHNASVQANEELREKNARILSIGNGS